MQRKKKVEGVVEEKKSVKGRNSKYPPEMLRFKKVRNGIHRHHKQIIKKGDILYAYPDELSSIVLEGFECLDEQIKEASKGIELGLRDRGNGWYDVINKKTGEALNDQAMRAKDARMFISGEEDKDEPDLVKPEEVAEDVGE